MPSVKCFRQIIYDDIEIGNEAYVPHIDDNSVHIFIEKEEEIIAFTHSCNGILSTGCYGYIGPYGKIVRCRKCYKKYNISPKKLKFIAKIARFGK